MYERMQELTENDFSLLHDSSMEILSSVGVQFNEEETLSIFREHGFRVEGSIVHFSETEIQKALETVPEEFAVTARNESNSITLGNDSFVMVPGYGAPFIVETDKSRREATIEDYNNFCRLVQTSKYLDMNGFMAVEPSDVPPGTAHLDMLLSSILLCDKPFMGSPVSKKGAAECLEMMEMIWGREKVVETPLTVSLINSLSPLSFSEEMAGSLLSLARGGQVCVISSLIMAGSSGPITLAGVVAQQNAEILAGITLTQLVRPGVPVIYGSTSAPMDMMSGGLSIGAPELSTLLSLHAQMARFYGLPSRGGGCLTDSNFPDMQAGVESCLSLTTAVRSGINFILHSCGILSSYLAMSYEKFLLDEELCGMIRKMIQPVEISEEEINPEAFREVGIGGEFMSREETVTRCRSEFFTPRTMTVTDYQRWEREGKQLAHERAGNEVKARLASWKKPDIEPSLEEDLRDYVKSKKS